MEIIPEINEFIGIYDEVVSLEFCNSLIEIMHQSHFVKERNYSYVQDKQLYLDSSHKIYTDKLYKNALEPCLKNYCANYPYLSSFNFVSSSVLMQSTNPMGGGYHLFHAENVDWNVSDRVLVWMIYLNDVNEGGETEFLYQGIKINPKRGRCLIWPGSFTHVHRGNPPSNTKYILTGWWQGSHGIRIFNH